MVPAWLHVLSILSLVVGGVCALGIAIDEAKHPQHMWIMNAYPVNWWLLRAGIKEKM